MFRKGLHFALTLLLVLDSCGYPVQWNMRYGIRILESACYCGYFSSKLFPTFQVTLDMQITSKPILKNTNWSHTISKTFL